MARKHLLPLYLRFVTEKDQMRVIVGFVGRSVQGLASDGCGIGFQASFSWGGFTECVNAFKFEQGVKVSPKLPGLCENDSHFRINWDGRFYRFAMLPW